MRLSYTQPFDWHKLLSFFAGRAIPGVEDVVDATYRRSLLINGCHRIVEVVPDASGGALKIHCKGVRGSTKASLQVLARTVFDLDAPISDIRAALENDEVLQRMLRSHADVRVPGAWDGFELTIRAILGQQISVKAATTIAGRIAKRYGEPLSVADKTLNRLFPTAQKLSRARFNHLGLVQSRIDAIRRVATATVNGDIRFDGTQSMDNFRRTMLSIKGIGEWTTEYVCMRAMRDRDAFPGSDLGLLSAVSHPERVTPRVLTRQAEDWRPWRAYAAMLLWGSLEGAGG